MRTHRPSAALILVLAIFGCGSATSVPAGPVTVQSTSRSGSPLALTLPNKDGSMKFGILGDWGTGSREQYETADRMRAVHDLFKFNIVLTVGDNLYGSDRPQDFQRKFEIPYKPLLDDGVKFYATLGNHDAREQASYKLFNMDGRRHYTFKAPQQDVRFFMLESDYMDPEQVAWVEKELKDAKENWKIAVFHHPLYSSAGRHGSDRRLREVLEPLFVKYNVSVVLTGHDHAYERTKPQQGIVYFVTGAGGQLRRGDLDDRSPITAKGFDTDQSFMVAEIDGDEMHFNAVSRQGKVFDSGVITRRK